MNTASSTTSVSLRDVHRFVVVAEDDDDMRHLVTESLRTDGNIVRSVASGRELLAVLSGSARGRSAVPSLVVTDLRMPQGSGMDVLNALRLAGWKVPVVVMTGFGDAEVHAQAKRLGAVMVLDKPFDLDALRDVARAYLREPDVGGAER